MAKGVSFVWSAVACYRFVGAKPASRNESASELAHSKAIVCCLLFSGGSGHV